MIYPLQNHIYRHYKSTVLKPMLYQIMGVAKHTETDELMVVYKPIYPLTNWFKESQVKMCCRPLKMFLEKVEVDGKQIPRFELVK